MRRSNPRYADFFIALINRVSRNTVLIAFVNLFVLVILPVGI